MTRSSATVDPKVGWKVDHRGYIHGGFDTPVFEKVKQKHNSQLTRNKREKKKIEESSTYGLNINMHNPQSLTAGMVYRALAKSKGN